MTVRPTIFRQLLIRAAVLVTPLVLFVSWGIYEQFQGDLRSERENLHRLRQFAEEEIHVYIEGTRGRLERLAQADVFRDPQPGEIENELRKFARTNPEFTNLALLDPEGRVVGAASLRPADPKFSLAKFKPFDAALRATGFFVSPVFKGEVTGRPTVILSQPVVGTDGHRLGTLIVPINLLELSRLLAYDPADSQVLVSVLDENGVLALRSFDAEKFLGRAYSLFPALQETARRPGGGSGELEGFSGELRVFDTGPVRDTSWIVAVSEPTSLVFTDARRNLWHALLLGAAVFGLLLILLFQFARTLARPITSLAQAAREQASGRPDATAPESGAREIVETARAFNEMVAARKETQISLEQSEHRYRTVIEQTGQMVYDYEVSSGRLTWYGHAAVSAITGLEIEEINLRGVAGWRDLLHPDDRADAVERLNRSLSTGEPCSAEYRLRHRDGTYRTVEERGVVLRDASGHNARMIGRMSDISDRRRASESLQHERELLRQIIDLVPHFIFAKNRRGQFILVNQATADVYGTTIANLVGKTDADFSSNPEDVKHFQEADAEVLRSGKPLIIAEVITDSKGCVRHLSTVKIPLRFAGETDPAVLGVSVDIPDLKNAEQARQQIEKKLLETQKLESLGVLAGGIAHDFNNLLTGILGNAGLARLERPPGTPGYDHLEQIERAAKRAAELCKQMLAYSGKGTFVIQKVDLNALLEETTQLLQISVSKRASLRFNLMRPLPVVQADATQLRQVVMNLVINASEALDERPGAITLATGVVQADAAYLAEADFSGTLFPGYYVFLEVGDNGIGMEPAVARRIFEPFFTTKFTGRGLGLAAVQGIVRGHQGAIRVISEPGKGTTFRVLLPAATGSADPLTAAPAPTSGWRGTGRVLVVDDEETVRKVSARLMERLGFTVDTAADGQEALLLFETAASDYVLVLLDQTMPRLDGEQTFRRLRQIRPQVRVILMSGFNKVDMIDRFTGQGLAGFVQKPFEVESLAAEVRRVVESHAQA
ncbi:MAG TPA: PAS domain S-box protein [Candidatus Didemnitutus sp.]|nr:PAS domain S-box protein [Candidatus Didemnitutus sp.]